MSKTFGLYNSSVGQKFLLALTGLFLCTFLIVHLTGNLLVFRDDGGQAFDHYADFMSTNKVIRILEIVLGGGFLAHIIWGFRTWLHNRQARPQRYAVNKPSENCRLASRVMFITGSIVFIFLVIHLNTFFVPTRFASEDGVSDFLLVQRAFADPLYDAFYLVALALLGYHLRQGFQSAFQTFGVRPGWRRPIDFLAVIFWLFIPIGYASMPLYFLWASLRGGN